MFEFADVLVRYAEQRGIEPDVLAAAEIAVKAGPEFEQRRHLAVDLDPARSRLQGADEQFEQGRLAGAVVADDAEALAVGDSEGNIVQHVEQPMPRAAQDQLREPVLGPLVNPELLVQIADGDAGVQIGHGYNTSPKACLMRMNSQPPSSQENSAEPAAIPSCRCEKLPSRMISRYRLMKLCMGLNR